MNKVESVVQAVSLTKRENNISIAIIGMLFFVFGFVSWINAILIPYFKIACELTNFQSYLVTFAFYISYLIFSIPSADRLVRNMVKMAEVPLREAILMMSSTPARIMGIEANKGALIPGKDADIVVFDEHIQIKETIIRGKRMSLKSND